MTAVVAQGDTLFALGRNGDVWRSAHGAGWQKRSTRPRPNTTVLAASPGALYVASTDPKILSRSNNGGVTFRRCGREGLPAGSPYVVGTANMRVGVLRRGRLALSSNGCKTWHRQRLAGNVRTIARNGNTWYAITERPKAKREVRFRLMASTDLGKTWTVRATRTPMKLAASPRLTANSLIADLVTANRLWLVHDNRLARSNDGGRTWTNVTPPSLRVSAVAPSTTRPNVIEALGLTSVRRAIVRTSSNAGASWTDTVTPDVGRVPNGNWLFASSSTRVAVLGATGVWTWAF
jgi:photosystem II stability/assembly factor-like uncharacterized protein